MRKDVELSPVSRALRVASVMGGWFDDEETNRLMGFGKGLHGMVAAREQALGTFSGESLGVYRGGEPVGYVALHRGAPMRRAARFQMFLAPEFRGKGIAPTALRLLYERLFEQAKLYRLEIEVLSTNRKAVKWLRHEGFTQEAFNKNAWWSDGDAHSTVTLRMLAPHWRKKRREEKN